jgi:probable phosphoglycerate mutase
VTGYQRVVVEADGASRGNPGPAAYGAVLKDALTGTPIAEDGTRIGVATNNVAEYSGLIAGLRLAEEFAPGADVEVRMDSQLVVEQLSGRWKVRHPDLKPLAAEANRLAPFGTTYTWVPRDQNAYADRLANEALDGLRHGVTVLVGAAAPDAAEEAEETPSAQEAPGEEPKASGYRGILAPSDRTTLILIRHGVTAHTKEKRFSGGLKSSNPGLSDEGRDQVRATAEWLRPIADDIDLLVASPVRRTHESAEIVAEVFGGRDIVPEPGFAEMEFGIWEGLTFAEVAERHQEDLDAWLGNLDHAPGGGESLRAVEERVLTGLERVLSEQSGKTIAVVSHVTPIKTMVAHALGAPLESIYRLELSPASVTVLSFFRGGREGDQPMASLRLFNARPTDEPFL